MDNLVYMITGASSGIGLSCARMLAEDNVTLFLVARNIDKLNRLSEELPGTVVPIQYDLRNLDNIKSIFEIVKDKKCKLNGLIYSAGMNADCPIKVNNVTLMQETMTVNAFAFLEMGKFFYSKKYSVDGAAIVAISSIASLTCDKGMTIYSASKAALNAMVKSMSKEFLRRKIRVNAILPAGVDTPMATEKMNVLAGVGSENISNREDPQSLGLIPSKNVASCVKMLLGDTAMYITGELLTIGAGRNY